MTITLRPVQPETDFPRIAELSSLISPEPVSAELVDEHHRNTPAGTIQQWLVALDDAGTIPAVVETWREPSALPDEFRLRVVVDPARRGAGIGRLLYDTGLAFAREQQAQTLIGSVRDSDPDSLGFVERRGFSIVRHIFESTLDLATFDESPFAGVIEAAEATGIRFFSLADLGDTPDAQRQLYEINRRLGGDIPGDDGTFSPLEDFTRFVFQASWYRADGQIVAADGDRWVGMAAVGYFDNTNSMYNMMTGVDRDYRGRNLALALKLLSIRCARKYGAVYMRTNNDSENAPMLAINRKLGYQPTPGFYRVVKTL